MQVVASAWADRRKIGWDKVEWKGRVVLITGGSRGIGRAIAECMADQDISIALNYRSDEVQAKISAERVLAKGAACELFQADVSQADQAKALVDGVLKRFGRIDVLVNNAGVTRDTLLLRMNDEQWNDVLATNLNGVFYCTRAAVKTMMRARFGRIVNIASISGVVGNAGQTNYSAAKAGLIGFTKAVARELASRNITANVVAPGLVDTDMTSTMGQAAYDTLIQSVPLGRAGRAEEIGEAVRFLASSDYITGQTLIVDGGLVMD